MAVGGRNHLPIWEVKMDLPFRCEQVPGWLDPQWYDLTTVRSFILLDVFLILKFWVAKDASIRICAWWCWGCLSAFPLPHSPLQLHQREAARVAFMAPWSQVREEYDKTIQETEAMVSLVILLNLISGVILMCCCMIYAHFFSGVLMFFLRGLWLEDVGATWAVHYCPLNCTHMLFF